MQNNEIVTTVINVADLPSMDHDRAEWLKNRWAMFWGACDYTTRANMVDAAHAEALEMHNALALSKIAQECLAQFQTGTPKHSVIADWNSAARHAGRLDLGITADCNTLQQSLAFRADLLNWRLWK